ncbi:MAG: stage V sporulation protein AA [Defluviitaleaceae bacterium]|nr:stage V sporulation protein AA [Defluviitaleaceae bacterium]MCL2273726.1 stage V sporulation protein AA [Defluviitaleaceae bacterium]
MDIYIKPKKKITLSERRAITIKDVADVVATKDVMEKVEAMELQKITDDGKKKKNFLISVTDIIKVIKKKFPEHTVNNVGEQDTWVQYAAHKSRDYAWWKWLKVAFVSVVLLVGSSTAIMSFHSDAQLPRIFENYFRLFYGEVQTNPRIITIPYSIGLAVGIIAFYNHFLGKKVTDDPTPIEVEMEQYENHVTETMVDLMSIREHNEKQGIK